MNVADLLRDTSRRLPDKVALVVDASGERLSFAFLDEGSDRVAAALQNWGVAPGDRVAILMHNIPEFIPAYFGILRAGAVVVPVHALLTPTEVAGILQDCGAAVVLSAEAFEPTARAAVPDATSVVSTAGWEEFLQEGGEVIEVARDDDDVAVLAYTSGTTGTPKGAMLTHGNLLANLRQQMAIPEDHVREEDVLFLALPLFHIFGLNVTVGLIAKTGATGVLVERFDPVTALRTIQDLKVTVVFGAPTMFGAWVSLPGADQYDLSRVRLAVSGAAPLAPEVLRDFRDMFGVDIYEGYGLTETAPTLTSARMATSVRPGSVGLPLPEVELRIVDETGKDVEVGDPGEIFVRGPNVFKGYWNREEESRAAFVDGWFRTGDVALRDEDGYIYLVDRKRDLIIVSGFNVFPSEVEQALLANPKVAEAAVVGVPHAYTGEAVKAYVVLAPGVDASAAEVMAEVQERLARFKRPEELEIVEALPHALTGKILRRVLRT
jgi:long-chain acyl-CoA synthetase